MFEPDNDIRKSVDGARLLGHLCATHTARISMARACERGRGGNFVIDIVNGPSMDGNGDPTQHVHDLLKQTRGHGTMHGNVEKITERLGGRFHAPEKSSREPRLPGRT